MEQQNALARGLVLALALVAPAAADPSPRLVGHWPPALGVAGPFIRVLTGHLNGDGLLDAVVLKGDTVVFLSAPAVHSAYHVVASGVQDVALFAGGAPEGLDALVTVGPAGLATWWLEDGATAFTGHALGGAAFAGARRIHTGDVDGLGHLDAAALAAGGATIVTLVADPSGAPGFVLRPPVALPHPATDFALVQLDGDPALEIAALTTVGLELLEQDGTLVRAVTEYPPGGAFTVFRDGSSTTDRLAWVTATADLQNEVLIVAGAAGVEPPVLMAPVKTVGLAALDVDADGNDDLVFSSKAAHALLLVFNRTGEPGATASFDFLAPGASAVIGFTPEPFAPAPGNEEVPGVGDLDADGDLDVLFLVQSSSQVRLVENPHFDAAPPRPAVDEVYYVIDEDLPPGGSLAALRDGTLELHVGPDPDLPAGATHLELVAWRQPALGAGIAPLALQHELHPLPAAGGWPLVVRVEIEEPEYPYTAAYSVELRFVELDAGGGLVAVHPTLGGTFAALPSSILALETHSGLGHVPAFLDEYTGPGEPSSIEAGGFVPATPIPDFVVGELPVLPPPTPPPPEEG